MEEETANSSGLVLDTNRDSVTGESVSKKPKTASYKVKLCVGDTTISADKQRLMETSPYFVSLLRFHAEDNLEAVSLVPPENVDSDCFVAVLNNLCNINAKLDITAANLWDCIVLSKYFQVEHIEEECLTAFQKMLLTLDMDQLLRLWRNGHECAIEKVTKLSLVGISLKMESASNSKEFVDLTVDELAALMSDDGFMPITEVDVCKALKTWCDHDPANRKRKQVLDRILAEVVWDDSTEHVIQSISGLCQKPDKIPKRLANSDDNAVPDTFRLEEVGASDGIIVGQFLYCFESLDNCDMSIGSFYRIDMKNRERKNLSEMNTKYKGESDPIAEYSLCFVQLADHAKIGCLVSHWQNLRYTYDGGKAENLANGIGLYDIATDKWQYLPCLPLPRVGCAIVQCGTFLYAIGGTEARPLEDEGTNAHYCYRLDVGKFAVDDEDPVGEWERIADLNTPRSNHRVKVHYGRIIVYDVQKRTEGMDDVDEEDKESWLEAYDPALNFWYLFQSA